MPLLKSKRRLGWIAFGKTVAYTISCFFGMFFLSIGLSDSSYTIFSVMGLLFILLPSGAIWLYFYKTPGVTITEHYITFRGNDSYYWNEVEIIDLHFVKEHKRSKFFIVFASVMNILGPVLTVISLFSDEVIDYNFIDSSDYSSNHIKFLFKNGKTKYLDPSRYSNIAEMEDLMQEVFLSKQVHFITGTLPSNTFNMG